MMSEEQVQNVATESEQGLDEAAQVRYLQPGDFILMRTLHGSLRLTLKDDTSYLRVKARRCFPYSYSTSYISIRDATDNEIGIIRDLTELSKEYRRWIEDDLDMRYYTPVVKSISAIKNRFGGVEWHVDTDRGPRRLITRGVHDTMTEIEPGRFIITDADGNRYELTTEQLDEPSRAKLNTLI